MPRPKVLIVIPCFNEGVNIGNLLSELKIAEFDPKFEVKHLVINDCSTDDSIDVIRESNSQAINLPFNYGIMQVFQLSIRIADALDFDYLMIIDGDGQHPVSEIGKLLSVADPATFVIGSRNFAKYPISRTRMNAIFLIKFLLKKKLGMEIVDPTSGFRLIPKICFRPMTDLNHQTNYLEDTVLILTSLNRSEVSIIEVEVNMLIRNSGESSSRGLQNILNYISLICKLLLVKGKIR